MERLWAPWRLTYIERPATRTGCVFCAQAAQSDEEALIVHRGERCYVVLNLYPYGSGHLMIVPFRHVAAPGDLDADERAELWELLDQVAAGARGGARRRRVTTSASTSARPRAPASRITCTCTSCRAGAATSTSCPCWRTCA